MTVQANEHNTCMQKLEELKTLESEKSHWIEKSAVFLFSGNFFSLSENEEDRLIRERIKVLKMELKNCK
jgi:hypothetical protein